MKLGIIDLMNIFWTIAGARSKEEGYSGLALFALRYVRSLAERYDLPVVLFAADGPQGRSWRRELFLGYKAGRTRHDPAAVAQLHLLIEALRNAGFTIAAVQADSGSSATEGEPAWFEGDDIAFSAAMIASEAGQEVHVFSSDWDLAQVLAVRGVVLLHRHNGEPRTSLDVEREFGVGPERLASVFALAGGEGWKPFPGSLIGANVGIGEKTAADVVRAFGSATAAMAFALSNQDGAFREKGIPKRVPELLRRGGQDMLDAALRCAALRSDAPVPTEFDVGDWDEAEAWLLANEGAAVKGIQALSEAAVDAAKSVSDPPAAVGENFPGAEERLASEIREHAIDLARRALAGERPTIPEHLAAAVEEAKAELRAVAEVNPVAEPEPTTVETEDRSSVDAGEIAVLDPGQFLALAALPVLIKSGVKFSNAIGGDLGALTLEVNLGAFRKADVGAAYVATLSGEAATALRSFLVWYPHNYSLICAGAG